MNDSRDINGNESFGDVEVSAVIPPDDVGIYENVDVADNSSPYANTGDVAKDNKPVVSDQEQDSVFDTSGENLSVTSAIQRRKKPTVKPTPKPRTSLLIKKESVSSESAVDSDNNTTECTSGSGDDNKKRSSRSSLTRSGSYEAALNRSQDGGNVLQKLNQSPPPTGESVTNTTNKSVNSSSSPEADTQMEVSEKPKTVITGNNAAVSGKKIPPPRPAVNPVGVLPRQPKQHHQHGALSARDGSPGRSLVAKQQSPPGRDKSPVPGALVAKQPSPSRDRSPVSALVGKHSGNSPRSASPPVVAPKPKKQVIQQALGQNTTTPSTGGVRPSASTPNISRYQKPTYDTNSTRTPTTNIHKSAENLKESSKRVPKEDVQQMVDAMSRLEAPPTGSTGSDAKSPRRRSESQFYFDLDGSEVTGSNNKRTSKKGKKSSKRESSTFYCDIGDVQTASDDSTQQQQHKQQQKLGDVNNKKSQQKLASKSSEPSSCTNSHKSVSGEDRSSSDVLCVSASDRTREPGNGDIENTTSGYKQGHDTNNVHNTSNDSQTKKPAEKSSHTKTVPENKKKPAGHVKLRSSGRDETVEVQSSDGGSSPVAPPRTKRKTQKVRKELLEQASLVQTDTDTDRYDTPDEEPRASSCDTQEVNAADESSEKQEPSLHDDSHGYANVVFDLERKLHIKPDSESVDGNDKADYSEEQIYVNEIMTPKDSLSQNDSGKHPHGRKTNPAITVSVSSKATDDGVKKLPGSSSACFPTDAEMNDMYLPMSSPAPSSGYSSGAFNHRFSGLSVTSSASDDYTPMGDTFHALMLGKGLDGAGGGSSRSSTLSSRSVRPSSWAGPDLDDSSESDLAATLTLMATPPTRVTSHDESRSTEDSDTDSSDDDNAYENTELLAVVENLQQVKAKLEKKRKKIFCIAEEMMTSETTFVGVLKLINEEFRQAMKDAKGPLGGPVVPYREIDQILKLLPLLQNFSEDLLSDLRQRVENWEENPTIADVFIKKGPFLKMYTTYIREFEPMCDALEELRKRFPEFDRAANEFEAESCSNLAIKHFMLKPIQRIPQYRLMLNEYQKNLVESSPDYEDTKTALSIVSEVADHANTSMAFGDNLKKLIDIQNQLMGEFEVIKPGRVLVKSGELHKLSRKEKQRRFFFLFSDTLLCTTITSTGYKYNSELPFTGMKVLKPDKEDFKNEFSIISTTRSFNISASTPEERDEWLSTIQETVRTYNKKLFTYMLKQDKHQETKQLTPTEDSFKLGRQAPVWIPDSRVSMCVKCHEEFTMTFRRHHCRACGKIFCWMCCDNRAPLQYQENKVGRVCLDCFDHLLHENKKWVDSLRRGGHDRQERANATTLGKFFIRGNVKSPGSIWGSFGKGKRKRASVLNEVKAMEANTDMSGYMGLWDSRKFKKFWFVLKEKVLYFYKASEDTAAVKSVALVGFKVSLVPEPFQKTEPDVLFELTHNNVPPMVFKTKEKIVRDKWVEAMQKATAP